MERLDYLGWAHDWTKGAPAAVVRCRHLRHKTTRRQVFEGVEMKCTKCRYRYKL